MSFPDELWIFAAGAVLLLVRQMLVGRRRRWHGLRALTLGHGMSAVGRDVQDLPVRCGQLELMRHGYNRRVDDVICLSDHSSARSFCYYYEIGFGKAHRPLGFTVAVVETDRRRPGLWIGRAPGMEPVGLFGRYQPATLPGQPNDPPPAVYAESPRWAETEMCSAIWPMLRTEEGTLGCELRGPYVAMYSEGIASPEFQIELLRRTRALADLMSGAEL
jgi:hypothetical protein